jgi:hypothetical protein
VFFERGRWWLAGLGVCKIASDLNGGGVLGMGLAEASRASPGFVDTSWMSTCCVQIGLCCSSDCVSLGLLILVF